MLIHTVHGCETQECIGQDKSKVRAAEVDNFSVKVRIKRIYRMKNKDVKLCEKVIRKAYG